MRPSAESLRAGEHVHQRGIAGRTFLDRAPGEVVERLVFAAIRRGKCLLPALVPLGAIGARRRLNRGCGESHEYDERGTNHDRLVFHGRSSAIYKLHLAIYKESAKRTVA